MLLKSFLTLSVDVDNGDMVRVEDMDEIKIDRVDPNTVCPNLFDLKPPNYNSQIETADSQGNQRRTEPEHEQHIDGHQF
jgi:hypothetical protein